MPYTIGLLEGFMGARDASIKQQQDQDAATREQEGKIYQYLLGSHDPEMRALAMSGMLESARPGKKGKGLSGYLGEVQGGSIYPQVLSRMNEMVPDEPPAEPSGPTPAARPGSAAMSTNQMTRPGSQPPQMPGQQLPPEPPPEGVQAGPMTPPPMDGAQGVVGTPPPPPPSKFKRRGTGVPTAEEIAEHQTRQAFEDRVKTITTNLIANGGTPEDVKRAVMGMAGAPVSLDTTANGPVLADPADPSTPIPTVRHRDGSITLINGSAPALGLVGYVKPTSSGGMTQYIRSTPETDAALGQSAPSPTHYWHVKQMPDGTKQVEAGEYTPPPSFSGTATIQDANANPTVVTLPREGGPPGPKNVVGPAVSTQPTQEQSDATALLTEVDKAIADAEAPKFLGQPKRPLTPAAKDSIAKQRAAAGGLPYSTYLEIQRASRQQRRPSPTPTTPLPAAQPGGGGSALSMSQQVLATLLERQKAKQGAAAAIPPPPIAPARAQGAGPLR